MRNVHLNSPFCVAARCDRQRKLHVCPDSPMRSYAASRVSDSTSQGKILGPVDDPHTAFDEPLEDRTVGSLLTHEGCHVNSSSGGRKNTGCSLTG